MINAYGVPVVTMNLVLKGQRYHMELGAKIAKIEIRHPYENLILKNVTLTGIELAANTSKNNATEIYDGIPTSRYQTDDIAGIHNASDYYRVGAIMVTGEPEKEDEDPISYKVMVDQIESLGGEFAAPDGTVTNSVDLASPDVTVADEIAKIPEAGGSLVMSSGEVAAPVTVDKSVTLAGVNAGAPQNFYQEV